MNMHSQCSDNAGLDLSGFSATPFSVELGEVLALTHAPDLDLDRFPWSNEPAIKLDGSATVSVQYLKEVGGVLATWHGDLQKASEEMAGVDMFAYLEMIKRAAFRASVVGKMLVEWPEESQERVSAYEVLMTRVRIVERTEMPLLSANMAAKLRNSINAMRAGKGMTLMPESRVLADLNDTVESHVSMNFMRVSDLVEEIPGVYDAAVLKQEAGFTVLSSRGGMALGDVICGSDGQCVDGIVVTDTMLDYIDAGGVVPGAMFGQYLLRVTADEYGGLTVLDSRGELVLVKRDSYKVYDIGKVSTTVDVLVAMYEHVAATRGCLKRWSSREVDDGWDENRCGSESIKDEVTHNMMHTVVSCGQLLELVDNDMCAVIHESDEFVVIAPFDPERHTVMDQRFDALMKKKMAVPECVWRAFQAGWFVRSKDDDHFLLVAEWDAEDEGYVVGIPSQSKICVGPNTAKKFTLKGHDVSVEVLIGMYITVVEAPPEHISSQYSYLRLFPWHDRFAVGAVVGKHATVIQCRDMLCSLSGLTWHPGDASVIWLGPQRCYVASVGSIPSNLHSADITGLLDDTKVSFSLSVRTVLSVCALKPEDVWGTDIGWCEIDRRKCGDCSSCGMALNPYPDVVGFSGGFDGSSKFHIAGVGDMGCSGCRLDYSDQNDGMFVNYRVEVCQQFSAVAEFRRGVDVVKRSIVVVLTDQERAWLVRKYKLDSSVHIVLSDDYDYAEDNSRIIVLVAFQDTFKSIENRLKLMRVMSKCDAMRSCGHHRIVWVMNESYDA